MFGLRCFWVGVFGFLFFGCWLLFVVLLVFLFLAWLVVVVRWFVLVVWVGWLCCFWFFGVGLVLFFWCLFFCFLV